MIDDFAPVTLAEVQAIAPLLTRVDQKYVVPTAALSGLVEQFGMQVLEIDGHRRFHYESFYFDTPEWHIYRAAASSRPRRFKVRTRLYLESGTCMLEVKSKDDRQRTSKQRIEYDRAHRHLLTEMTHQFLIDRTPGLDTRALRGVLATSYERWSLADLSIGVRVTVDTEMAFVDRLGRSVGIPGHAIVETKSVDGSCPADRALWRSGFRPTAVSKYALGVAAFHPELPRNRWHRVLQRYVRPSDYPAVA